MNTLMFRHVSRRTFCSQIPVISVPKYMEASIKKQQNRLQRDIDNVFRERTFQGDRRIPVITSKSSRELNFYLGQRVKPHDLKLATGGWLKGIKYRNDEVIFRDYSRNVKFQENLTIDQQLMDEEDERITSFAQLKLDPRITDVITQVLKYSTPTEIQTKLSDHITSRRNVICSAETGSGKTMSYMAPLMHMMVREKDQQKDQQQEEGDLPRSPLTMILVPNRELAHQVGAIAHSIGIHLNIGVATMVPGPPQYAPPHTGYDVVVTTMKMALNHLNTGILSLENLKHLVLDEADTLLDDSFSGMSLALLNKLNINNELSTIGTQLILVSATLPTDLSDLFGDQIDVDSMITVTTEKLHRVPSHISQRFIRANRFDRDSFMLRIIRENLDRNEPTMIFSNRTKNSNWISYFLNNNNIDCLKFNKSVEGHERQDNLDRFNSGDVDVLACTDLAARGLDPKRVKHVLNFECPRFVADYLHRIGRTGRAGMKGQFKVTTFVSFKPDVFMVQELEKAIRLDTPISGVDANIKKHLTDLYEEKKLRMSTQTTSEYIP